VVTCVSGFIEFYYLFLFPDFKGVNVSYCYISINNHLLVVKCSDGREYYKFGDSQKGKNEVY